MLELNAEFVARGVLILLIFLLTLMDILWGIRAIRNSYNVYETLLGNNTDALDGAVLIIIGAIIVIVFITVANFLGSLWANLSGAFG